MKYPRVLIGDTIFTTDFKEEDWNLWVRDIYRPKRFDDENYEYDNLYIWNADWRKQETPEEIENYRILAGYGGVNINTPCPTDSCGFINQYGEWECRGSCEWK